MGLFSALAERWKKRIKMCCLSECGKIEAEGMMFLFADSPFHRIHCQKCGAILKVFKVNENKCAVEYVQE